MKRDRTPTPETPESSPPARPKKSKPQPKPKTEPESKPNPKTPRDSWTDAKRNALVTRVFAAGLQQVDTGVLAAELGVSRQQIQNQLKPNRGNVRRVVEGLFLNEKKEEVKRETP